LKDETIAVPDKGNRDGFGVRLPVLGKSGASAGWKGRGKIDRSHFPGLPSCRRLIGRSSMLQLSVNGEARQIPAPSTVLQLLESMQLAGKRIAVERNGDIVPKGLHATTVLADGDVLEIVVAVGGG
jgi:sulfur carrier protein